MEANKSLELIEGMFLESKRSLKRNSVFFILWGILMSIAGLIEFALFGKAMYWLVWPIAGILGGIISSILGSRQRKNGVSTFGDRIMAYTWIGFMLTLIICIVLAVSNGISPAPLVLALSAYATFISSGISKFAPLFYGALFLAMGAIATGFFISAEYHGLVFALALLLGYIYPGIKLKQSEDGQA